MQVANSQLFGERIRLGNALRLENDNGGQRIVLYIFVTSRDEINFQVSMITHRLPLQLATDEKEWQVAAGKLGGGEMVNRTDLGPCGTYHRGNPVMQTHRSRTKYFRLLATDSGWRNQNHFG
jgi:hypothetical protein